MSVGKICIRAVDTIALATAVQREFSKAGLFRLTLSIPKAEEAKTRRIKVEAKGK